MALGDAMETSSFVAHKPVAECVILYESGRPYGADVSIKYYGVVAH